MAQFNNASIHVSLYAPCVLATLLCAIVHWLAFRHIICLALNLLQESQYLIVEYVLLYKKHLSFAGAHSQMNTTLNQN